MLLFLNLNQIWNTKKEYLLWREVLPSANQMLKHGLVGTPEKIRERLEQYVDAGVDQFLLAFQDPLDTKALELFMNTVGS